MKKRALQVAITADVEPNEAVQKDNEYCNYYCWPSIFASKTPDLAPNAEHSSIWYTEW